MIEIELPNNEPIFDFKTTLDNIEYQFTFKWNVRGSFWVVDLAESDGTPIILGERLNTNLPLFSQYGYNDKLPNGTLWVTDIDTNNIEPALDSLGTRIKLVYDS